MDFFTCLYLVYSFLAFYHLFLFSLIYLQNKNQIYEFFKPKRIYSLSIVIPCYNEGKSIGKTIESLLKSDYKGLKKIIVVDDCSTDDSFNVISSYAKKYQGKVIALKTPKNTGKASGPKNFGAKFVKTELIGFTDADSYPDKDAISKMIGFFNDPEVGAVTSRVLVYNPKNFIERLQAIEYKIIAFTRKLFGFVDSIYVTNGPLSIYTKKAFDDVGGFDEKNMTEDIELTWNILSKGYKVHISMLSKVYTIVPNDIKSWYKQRIRWNIGGLQTVFKYNKFIFKKGMLGLFIIPFFVSAWFLGLSGLAVLSYRVFSYLISRYLVTSYSIEAQTALLRFNEFYLAPDLLLFFGAILLVFSFLYTIISLSYSKEGNSKGYSLIDLFFYSIFYLLTYPLILISSFLKYLKGRYSW